MIAEFNAVYKQYPLIMTLAFMCLGLGFCLFVSAWLCEVAEWISEWWYRRRKLF